VGTGSTSSRDCPVGRSDSHDNEPYGVIKRGEFSLTTKCISIQS
jgi:hypothetical protein